MQMYEALINASVLATHVVQKLPECERNTNSDKHKLKLKLRKKIHTFLFILLTAFYHDSDEQQKPFSIDSHFDIILKMKWNFFHLGNQTDAWFYIADITNAFYNDLFLWIMQDWLVRAACIEGFPRL